MSKCVPFNSFYKFSVEKQVIKSNHQNEKRVLNMGYYMGGIVLYPFLKNTKLIQCLKNIVSRIFAKETKKLKQVSLSDEKIFSKITKRHSDKLSKPKDPKGALQKINSVVKNVIKNAHKKADLVIKLEALQHNIEHDFDPSLDSTKRTVKLLRSSIQDLVENDLSPDELEVLKAPKISKETLELICQTRDKSSHSSSTSNSKSSKQHTTLDDPLKWPVDDDFSLDAMEKKEIDDFINYNKEVFKDKFRTNPNWNSIECKACVTIIKECFGKDGTPGGMSPSRRILVLRNEILVDTGEKLGRGGQTSVQKYYGLLSEKYFAVKDLPKNTNLRQTTVGAYNSLRGQPGCVSYVCLTDDQAIEPCYDGTLKSELAKQSLQTTAEKVDAIAQIAMGLHSVHSELHRIMIIQNTDKREWVGARSHGDLKLENIFTRRKNQKLKMDVGDFGHTGAASNFAYSPNYTSPQTAQFLLNARNINEIAFFNHAFGERNDMWQFGVIAASILKNELHAKRPPLGFLKKFKNGNEGDEANAMVSLKQDEVDDEIKSEIGMIEKSHLAKKEKKAMKRCWKLVNELLQVQAYKRPHIEHVQKKLKKAKVLVPIARL